MRILSTQKLLAGGLAALSLVLAGCLTDSKDKDEETAPVITTQPTDTSVTEGANATFTVVASGSGTLTYKWSKGADTVTIATSATLTLTAVAYAADSTTYKCVISNAKGSVTSSAALLRVDGLVSSDTLTAGAQSNATHGSSIDLDNFAVYKIDTAKTMAAQIDLIFAYSTSAAAAAIYAPYTAKNGFVVGTDTTVGFSILSDFSPANQTEIKTSTVTDLSVITTKSQVDSLWAAGTAVSNGRLVITAGTTFLAKSNLNKVVLVKVLAVTQLATGDAQLMGIAKF